MSIESLDPKPLIPVFARRFGSWQIALSRDAFAPETLAEHYDRAAPLWQDKIDRLGFGPAYAGLIHAAMGPRKVCDQLDVLDLGTGSGAMSLAFVQTKGRPRQLTGLDLSSEMLSEAQHRLRCRGVEMVPCQGDIEALPFDNESFDVVLVAHVLEHLPDPSRALSEIFRVLRPGGRVIACITRPSRFGAYIQILWRTHRVSEARALEWFARAGFADARREDLTGHDTARRFSLGYTARKL